LGLGLGLELDHQWALVCGEAAQSRLALGLLWGRGRVGIRVGARVGLG
jgi:hypothetical protein